MNMQVSTRMYRESGEPAGIPGRGETQCLPGGGFLLPSPLLSPSSLVSGKGAATQGGNSCASNDNATECPTALLHQAGVNPRLTLTRAKPTWGPSIPLR